MDDSSRIRLASPADLAALVSLEREAFSDPWTSEQLSETIAQSSTVGLVVADGAGVVVGYLLGRVVADEAEILTLAVRLTERRRGLGRKLLDAALATMRLRGVRSVWLEVRQSNEGAQALYTGAGFIATGVRRGYYRRPVEDALVLKHDLTTHAFAQPPLR